jgi:hypothetical protein
LFGVPVRDFGNWYVRLGGAAGGGAGLAMSMSFSSTLG